MIEQEYGAYYGVCDGCETTTESCESWEEAKDLMKEKGWKFSFDEERKEWSHTCPDCQKRQLKKFFK